MSGEKRYLGDAVYVSFDGNGLWLTTEDGIRATNTIYLESDVWVALRAYVAELLNEQLRRSNPRLFQ